MRLPHSPRAVRSVSRTFGNSRSDARIRLSLNINISLTIVQTADERSCIYIVIAKDVFRVSRPEMACERSAYQNVPKLVWPNQWNRTKSKREDENLVFLQSG